MMIEKLQWDSDFFNYPVGKVFIKAGDIFDEKTFFNEQKDFELVYVFAEEPIRTDYIPLKHVDDKVTLAKVLGHDAAGTLSFACKPYEHSDRNYKELLDLAYVSGIYSRFNTDPGFVRDEYRKLYHKWIDESVMKTIAMEILTYRAGPELAGFISVADHGNKSAAIGLVAVAPEFQGQGIGGILLKDAETYAIRRNFKEMRISTQRKNENSLKLYRKNGYEIQTIVHIYHYWKKA